MDTVRNFGAEAVMTSAGHLTGTDRCEEAVKEFSRMSGREPRVVINIQGDEPVIDPQQILRLADTFRPDVHEINTLVLPTEIGPDTPVIKDKAFAAVTGDGRVLYFSRYTLPYVKSGGTGSEIPSYRRFVSLPPSALEKSESLEQNRWLENGGTIRVFETATETLSVDTPEDVIAVERYLESHPDLI
ncbi:hypothetical protein CHS0354_018480 [Potamilus streckersoni]|uniref:3-deoxy-manno-octulosonate cytidylyltransferase n=1 Tax=Potamilus streckersoni TaxID=2493646 RepID=A0AAE0W9Z2_9BIVA|nr:hypothetical protein CHS0354_018480 [Potamilus streckersoni]